MEFKNKLQKLIEDIKRFFSTFDIKGIFFTFIILFILVTLCKSSEVQASAVYNEVDSISFTGTQYIDTGIEIFSTNNWEIEFKFSLSCLLNYNALLALDSGVTTWESWVDKDGAFYVRTNGSKTQCATLETNTIYTIKLVRTGINLKVYLDGSQLVSIGGQNTTIDGSLYFGHRDNNYSYLNLYSLRLTQDSVLVRDYVPCVDSAGTLGFYDKATDTIFYNSGTGNFLVGTSKENVEIKINDITHTFPALPDNSAIFNDELFLICDIGGTPVLCSFIPKENYSNIEVKVAYYSDHFEYTNARCCYYVMRNNSWSYDTWQPGGSGFNVYDPVKFYGSTMDIYNSNTFNEVSFSHNIASNNNIMIDFTVDPTDITQDLVLIKTQPFSDEFRLTHKCYYRYVNIDDESNSGRWFLADISSGGYYYTYALENGAYIFKIEDQDGKTVCTATMNITNIQHITDAQDSSVLCPILTVEPSQSTGKQVRIKTQTFNADTINNYKCFWWVVGEETSDNKKEALPRRVEDDTYYFCTVTEEDKTFAFVFYDKLKQKYSDIVTITVIVNNVLAYADEYGTIKTMDHLLHTKFGVFYDCFDLLNETYHIIMQTEATCPTFEITLPKMFGGATVNVLDFRFYNEYRTYIHYIIAGFAYIFFAKKMIRDIPNLIHR